MWGEDVRCPRWVRIKPSENGKEKFITWNSKWWEMVIGSTEMESRIKSRVVPGAGSHSRQ